MHWFVAMCGTAGGLQMRQLVSVLLVSKVLGHSLVEGARATVPVMVRSLCPSVKSFLEFLRGAIPRKEIDPTS